MTPLPKGATQRALHTYLGFYHVLKWEETILLKAREQKDASLVSLFATFPWGGVARLFRADARERERER